MARKTPKARKVRRTSLLDVAVAALAGGSVAFALFAMPADLFSHLIELSRLPSLVPAAEPPLGATARLAATAAGGAAAFIAIFALMRALDGPARPKRASKVDALEEPLEEAVPRLRRADAHPDAPPRRPIFAARDLGEVETVEPEPVEEEPPVEPQAELEPLPLSIFPAVPEPEPEPVPEPQAAAPPVVAAEPVAVSGAEAEPAPDSEEGGAIPELLARLEGGLRKRSQALPPPPPLDPPAGAEPARHSLRSALRDLQKMAGQAG